MLNAAGAEDAALAKDWERPGFLSETASASLRSQSRSSGLGSLQFTRQKAIPLPGRPAAPRARTSANEVLSNLAPQSAQDG